MLRSTTVLLSLAVVAVVACSKKDKDKTPPSTGSSAMAGSGSAAGSATDTGSGSGSAMAGSGSGSAGSGSADSGSADAGSASGSAVGSGSADAGSGAAVDFDKLPHEDKVKFMKANVMPAMKRAFQKFDPKEYASFTCKTCHGKDPQKSKYEMPNGDIPKLDFAALKKGDDAEMAKFMSEIVKPQMAKILGKHDMTQAEPTGFGCLACHMEKKKK